MINLILQKLSNLFGVQAKTNEAVISRNAIQTTAQDVKFNQFCTAESDHIVLQTDAVVLEHSIEEHVSPLSCRINVGTDDMPRYIAYTVSGNLNANKALLCLPGLLETRQSFTMLHAYFLQFREIKLISIDFAGRGDSDPLPDNEQYLMSLYLTDVCKLINEIIYKEKKELELTILGTSMGGVLAMYLTQALPKPIHQIILNDVALTVNWTALFNLYKSMNNEVGFMEVRQLAQTLKVNERAISDVQLPGHFDLPYRADVWGMNFHDALSTYKGHVALIYGGESKICTKRRVDEAIEFSPRLKAYCVEGVGHPVPYSVNVCAVIQEILDVMG